MKYTNLVKQRIKNTNGFKYTCLSWEDGGISSYCGGSSYTIERHEIYEGVGKLNGEECVIACGFVFPVSELERTEQLKEFLNKNIDYEIF